MIAAERETTITMTDADDYALVYTCADITGFKKKLDRGVELVSEGEYVDGTAWAEFRIPRQLAGFPRVVRATRTLTPEQRASMSKRMKELWNRSKEQAS